VRCAGRGSAPVAAPPKEGYLNVTTTAWFDGRFLGIDGSFIEQASRGCRVPLLAGTMSDQPITRRPPPGQTLRLSVRGSLQRSR
jgi:hypothetical protein